MSFFGRKHVRRWGQPNKHARLKAMAEAWKNIGGHQVGCQSINVACFAIVSAALEIYSMFYLLKGDYGVQVIVPNIE